LAFRALRLVECVNVKFLVVGYGRVGRAVAAILKSKGFRVEAVDRERRLEGLIDALHILDASRNLKLIAKLAESFDCTCGCLPSKEGFKFMASLAEKRLKLVDVSFTYESPLKLSQLASERGSLILPDCGLAPGLSNMFVGLCRKTLGPLAKVEIRVGGIPEKPEPPLYHSTSWSAEDLIEEYTRPARYVEDGVVKSINPLDSKLQVEVFDLRLEGFVSDGLRTLLRMEGRPRSMREVTLRWPGHLDVMKLLLELGFLGDEVIDVQGVEVKAKSLTAKLLESRFKSSRDLVLMEVEAESEKGEKALLRLRGSTSHWGLTTMALATGAVCSQTAVFVAEGLANSVTGVVPPEDIPNLELLVARILKELRSLGFEVEVFGLDLEH